MNELLNIKNKIVSASADLKEECFNFSEHIFSLKDTINSQQFK